MLRDVASVQTLPHYRLHVRFDNGTQGVVDVAQLVQFTGVFELLHDPEFVAKASVHIELGTVWWPNNADLDSDVLYARFAGIPVPEYSPRDDKSEGYGPTLVIHDSLLDRISTDPHVCHGRPCIRRHRIWVSLIIDLLADGMTTE